MICVCHPVPTLEWATLGQLEDAAGMKSPKEAAARPLTRCGRPMEECTLVKKTKIFRMETVAGHFRRQTALKARLWLEVASSSTKGPKDGAVNCVDRWSGTFVSPSGILWEERDLGSVINGDTLSQGTYQHGPKANACVPWQLLFCTEDLHGCMGHT